MERAIKRGYMSLLPKYAYPFAVLALSIDPGEINVNIHPKKHEIRFYHSDDVFHFIAGAVSTTLRQADLIPEVVEREKDAVEALDSFTSPQEKKVPVSAQTSFQADMGADVPDEGRLDICSVPLYQVLDSYIIAQSEADDVIMIDQHAAAERANFERLIERYGRRIDKQTLLRPYVPELSPHQFYLIRENEEALRDMGFDIDRLGDDSYIIRAIPVVFHGMIGEDEITEVIVQLVEESGKREERIKVLFSTAACKASIKAGEKLSYDSMRAIVTGLRNAKLPFTCPHGRPTMIRLTKKEIEKRFKRR
uniref:DNA mismatch repair protein MutL n=1 Tax=Candidatus Methanophaga sp. ANME-1 ERB7 TaxID=2759913 RepID=A0A7G9Z810_9EURY|nr:DNA mismatch repair protein MutL [Methanosarcinales archaeon ANME-1 ERB7]